MSDDAAPTIREALNVLRSRDGEADILYLAARALRLIIIAAHRPRADLVPQSDVEDVTQALATIFVVLENEIAGALPVERLAFGLGMAVKLVSFFGKTPDKITLAPEIVADIADYAELLSADLQILAVKRRIDGRGNPVMRSYLTNRAVAAAERLSTLPN